MSELKRAPLIHDEPIFWARFALPTKRDLFGGHYGNALPCFLNRR
jgi:hypothetical protein